MSVKFPVTYEGRAVGEAEVWLQGLYYRILCLCEKGDNMKRIYVTGEEGMIDLGICVGLQGRMGMDTRIPVKKLGTILRFQQKDHAGCGTWVPLQEGNSLSELSVIRNARLCKRNGEYGLSKSIADGYKIVNSRDLSLPHTGNIP